MKWVKGTPGSRGLVLAWLSFSPLFAVVATADEPSTKSKSETPAPSKTDRPVDSDRIAQRVRELIYILRLHRVFERSDEWGGAICELVEIGPPAVPELVRELETTDRDATLRALGFTLRAIGDPRAVPALIGAIPKTLRPPGSDCGIGFDDAELFAFLKRFDRSPGDKDYMSYGRPVNEILDTLQVLTGHEEPPGGGERDALRHVFLRGSEADRANQMAMFKARQDAWQNWWNDNFRQFVTQDQLDSVDIKPRDEDLVAKAGLQKFGPMFPTGPDVRLGDVREVELESLNFWDGESHFDFDTGRAYEYLAGQDAAAESGEGKRDFGKQIAQWTHTRGIDLRNFGSLEGNDLYIWFIDDQRWDTLESEVRREEPLALGREASRFLAPFDKTSSDFQWDRGGTFLFTTREGGRGIVRTFPPDKQTTKRRLQYRMWLTEGAEAAYLASGPAVHAPSTPFAEARKVSLAAPGESALYLFSLTTGQKHRLPDGVKPEQPGKRSAFDTDEELLKWCRDRDIDLASHVTSGMIAFAGGNPPPPRKNLMQLMGLDMVASRVRPAAFDELGVERVREIVNRTPVGEYPLSWMDPYPEDAVGRYTWAFRTRDGRVGLLQIDVLTKEPQSITFRYRISE